MLRESCFSFVSTWRSISAAGSVTDTRRSSPSSVSTFAIPYQESLVRREGLEPTCLAAPAPKAGASTNSATLAAEKAEKNNVLYLRCPFEFSALMPVSHYENFPVASLLLPKRLRAPIEVIYRFARSADDFADEGDAPPAERLAQLQAYRDELARIAAGEPTRTPLFADVARLAREHELPL